MSSVASEAPSARAMRLLTNRNNLADQETHKYVQQARQQMTTRITEMDKYRLDVADFLTTLQRCPSDDLQEELESDEDQSDDGTTPYLYTQRNIHTAKTVPIPFTRHRHDHTKDDDYNDRLSLDDHPLRRQTKNGGLTRREMLYKRRQEDERAKVSDYDKAEIFLAKLRDNDDQGQKDDFRYLATKKGFTTYLLNKIHGDSHPDQEGDGWVGTRMVYPIKRLGHIAAKFKQQASGRNTPVDETSASFLSPRKKTTTEGRRDRALTRHGSNDTFYPNHQPLHRGIFEITENDPPAKALPRSACMPSINRPRRDLVADLGRAYGFGEAALVAVAKPAGVQPPLSRASIAERRRLQRQSKVKLSVHLKARSKPVEDLQGEPQGADRVRALLGARIGSQGLDDRIKAFMGALDEQEDQADPELSPRLDSGGV
ncbi:hypothetical protein ACOMHN_052300 [Nucella lapillus]